MTKKWSNLNLPGALHYVTGIIRHRIPIFKQEKCCSAYLEVLAELVRSWPSKLIAFVIMPDHFHLIVNPRDGDIRGFAGALKSLTAGKIIEITKEVRFKLRKPAKDGSIHQVWQDSFKAIPLWSLWMIWQKINYIHANPLRARLVTSAKDYRWSSFRAFYSESNAPLPIDHEWWWPEDSKNETAGASPLILTCSSLRRSTLIRCTGMLSL
jgi:putative transposase